MKCTSLALLLCLLCIPSLFASAANTESTNDFYYTSAVAFSSRPTPNDISSSSASFFYNDGNGEPTAFEMHRENDRMTIAIRQHNVTLWSRTIKTDSSYFSVTRHTENGQTFFLITAGNEQLKVESDNQGVWRAEPGPAVQN